MVILDNITLTFTVGGIQYYFEQTKITRLLSTMLLSIYQYRGSATKGGNKVVTEGHMLMLCLGGPGKVMLCGDAAFKQEL